MEKTAIITVLYNSMAVLADFFRSLGSQTYRDFVLYVVDNASPDDSLEQAGKMAEIFSFPVRFIESPVNNGIAAGNNLGIRAAMADGCRWVVLANNDTVWEPDALENLLVAARQQGAAMAAPQIKTHAGGRRWYAGGGWNRWRGGTTHYRDGRIISSCPVDYAPSCCLLINGSVFGHVGLMDERFFLYYDDADFVRRATQAGQTLLYVPGSLISHKESASAGTCSPLVQYWLSRNLLLFTHKHFSKPYWFYVLMINLIILFTKRVFTFDRRQWAACRSGFCDGIRLCAADRSPHPIPEPVWPA